ncbi:MAG: NAD(+) synthase, partial [Terriglobales bacterium]
MRLIRIGLANINTTVGALRSNTEKMIEIASQMAENKCTVGCFQEQCIAGYPTEDLIQWSGFVRAQWRQLEYFTQTTGNFPCPTVFVLGLTVAEGGHLYNCAAVVGFGRILGIVPKEKLPTYGVFYEGRTFSPGNPGHTTQVYGVPFGDLIFDFPFGVLGAEVCEDIWVPDGPMRRRAYCGAELVINLSASPWRAGVLETRRELISTRAADNQATVVYTNQVGGNDALVFDGGGFVCQNGRMLAEAPRWREGFMAKVVDLERTARLRHENTTWRTCCDLFFRENKAFTKLRYQHDGLTQAITGGQTEYSYPAPGHKSFVLPLAESRANPREQYFEDLIEGMKIGLAGYFEKTGVFERIGIALSGGKDSVLTLIVTWLYARDRFSHLSPEAAREAIGDFIHCFTMPSRFNSENTKEIARCVCDELGVTLRIVPIDDAFDREVAAVRAMLGGTGEPTRVTLQNIQARIRGMRMWDWSNSARAMWVQTGDMSEKAVGYTTIGGDLMGAYSLLGYLPKTVVIELLRYLGGKFRWQSIPKLLATKSSPELEEGQEGEQDLMPFPVLDACFALFAGEKLMPAEVYQALRTM